MRPRGAQGSSKRAVAVGDSLISTMRAQSHIRMLHFYRCATAPAASGGFVTARATSALQLDILIRTTSG